MVRLVSVLLGSTFLFYYGRIGSEIVAYSW